MISLFAEGVGITHGRERKGAYMHHELNLENPGSENPGPAFSGYFGNSLNSAQSGFGPRTHWHLRYFLWNLTLAQTWG